MLYGHDIAETRLSNSTRVACTTTTDYAKKGYSVYFNTFFVVYVGTFVVILASLYTLIGRVIKKSNSRTSKVKPKKPVLKSESAQSSQVSKNSVEHLSKEDSDENKTDAANTVATKKEEGKSENKQNDEPLEIRKHMSKQRYNRAKGTTLIFFLITIVFGISYIPNVVLQVVYYKFHLNITMNLTEKILFRSVSFSFVVNHVANCFIYGFCDHCFIKDVKDIYKRLYLKIRRDNQKD